MGKVEALAVADMPASKSVQMTEARIPDSMAFPIVTVILIYHPKRGLAELLIMILLKNHVAGVQGCLYFVLIHAGEKV